CGSGPGGSTAPTGQLADYSKSKSHRDHQKHTCGIASRHLDVGKGYMASRAVLTSHVRPCPRHRLFCVRSGRSGAMTVNDSGDCRLVEATPVGLACDFKRASGTATATPTADHEARRRGYRKSRAPTFRHGARSTNTRCLQRCSDGQQPSESKAPMTTKPLDHRYPRRRSGVLGINHENPSPRNPPSWTHPRSPSHAIHTQALTTFVPPAGCTPPSAYWHPDKHPPSWLISQSAFLTPVIVRWSVIEPLEGRDSPFIHTRSYPSS
ncbi:hypothetical protein CKAH01_17690, partial [Colletotrichum kahawae]